MSSRDSNILDKKDGNHNYCFRCSVFYFSCDFYDCFSLLWNDAFINVHDYNYWYFTFLW